MTAGCRQPAARLATMGIGGMQRCSTGEAVRAGTRLPTARIAGRRACRVATPTRFPACAPSGRDDRHICRLFAPATPAALLVALLVVVVLLERLARTTLVLGLAAAGLVLLGFLQVRVGPAFAVALGERDFQLVDLVPLGVATRAFGDGQQFLEPLSRRLARVRRGRRVRVRFLVVVFRIDGCSLPVGWWLGASRLHFAARCASEPALARSSTVIALAMNPAASLRFDGMMSVLPALASCLKASI